MDGDGNENEIQGQSICFGKNIDTDQIYPGRFVEYTDVEDIKNMRCTALMRAL